jgi:phage major head subunit gpT-like protein
MVFNTVLLEKGLQAIFNTAYQGLLARPYLAAVRSIMTEVPSSAASEKYGWLGDFPLVQEWIGDRNVGDLKDYDYTIKNKDWIIPIAIHENELADDQVGAIAPRVQMMAEMLSQWPLELVGDLLKNGDSNLAYDGQAFFANRASPNDNLLAGTGVTLAAIKTDIASARAAMMRFATDKGRPLGIQFDTIVCPPELEATILEATKTAAIITTGQGAMVNPVANWIKNVISLPELSDTNDWYGLATGYALRPLIYQARQGVRAELDDTERKRNKRMVFQADMRGNAGYGFWQMAVKVVNS